MPSLPAAECEADCSGHGTCMDAVCVCDQGYAGSSCAYRPRAWRPPPSSQTAPGSSHRVPQCISYLW